MQQKVIDFYRQELKAGLAELTPEERRVFRLMYSHKNPEKPIEAVVDSIPEDKLDWALYQVDNTRPLPEPMTFGGGDANHD